MTEDWETIAAWERPGAIGAAANGGSAGGETVARWLERKKGWLKNGQSVVIDIDKMLKIHRATI